MRPSPNPFVQLVPLRVEAAIHRLREQIWCDARTPSVEGTEASPEHCTLELARNLPRRPVASGECWGLQFDQRWYRLTLPAPAHADGQLYLEWRDQGEATLWIDGMPHYGFDVAHRRAPLPASCNEIWVEAYCCQTAIWHPDATGLSPEGSRFTGARLLRRDDQAWDLCQELQAFLDLGRHLRARFFPLEPQDIPRVGHQPSLDDAPPAYRLLLRGLSESLDHLDRGDREAALTRLAQLRRRLRTEGSLLRAVLTGHAHIDLVWLWPERIGEAKAVHTFSTVNRLMELYPEFKFAYSQPASYRAVAGRSPALARAVAGRIAEGRWQATGALEVESDTQLPHGEALARSFLLGQEGFRSLRGEKARLLWLPDVFGYSACLPQLMRLAGVEFFFTTKLTWSAITRFPYSSFRWRGNDGSEVIAHVTQNAGYNNRLDLAELDANAWGHVQADIHESFLHPTGYGDGGGGPTEEMCERARRLSSLAGLPALEWGQPEAFFEELAGHREELPVYQGECYLEYHRGVLTTHADLKAAFRGLEKALQLREAVSVLRRQAPDLIHPWRRLIFAQFHDYIPGSSIAEVYHEGVPELLRLAGEQRTASVQALHQPGTKAGLMVFNPLPQPWSGWVAAPGQSRPAWCTLPPLSSSPWSASDEEPEGVCVTERFLDNGLVQARVRADGGLESLCIRGQNLEFSEAAAQLWLYPDAPANYDAWDIDRHSLELGTQVATPVTISSEQTGPERAAIVISRSLGQASQLRLRYVLEAGSSCLRIELEVDWHETKTLLKLEFPTEYRGLNACFGAPFGSSLRSQQPGQLSAEAQWEVPGSRWAAISHEGGRRGLALITEAKYGFAAKEGRLSVSLLRSARITGCDDQRYAVAPSLRRLRPESPFSDQGLHHIRLALSAYEAAAEGHEHPARLADTLFIQPCVHTGEETHAGLLGIEGGTTLIPAWAMPLQEGHWVLRLHEVAGIPGEAILRLADGWSAQPCALDGGFLPESSPSQHLSFRPYEILSLRLFPDSADFPVGTSS